ncbi:MAG: M48 family metallopeptidase [Nanoarchaeota archaeon]
MERLSFYDEIRNNKLKSIALIFIVFIIFIFLGYFIALAVNPGYFFIIMIFSILFSLSYILIGYYNSDKIAIASVRAKPASRNEHRMFFHAVESIVIASGLPMPKLYVMESSQINAFASGRDPAHAVICMTTGAIEKLNKQELEGVIAHEMSHIANLDIRFMTLTAVLVGMVAIIAEMFLRNLWFSAHDDRREGKTQLVIFIIAIAVAILAPIATQLISLAISRKREFGADSTAVKFTRYPDGLMNALEKIKSEHLSEQDRKNYPREIAPLFISDPFKKKIQGLFSTHPDINERIRKLKMM